jgi:hypothetical protein
VAERRQKTLRDMAISMGLIAVVALVLYGMYGGVTFAPGGASDGVAPTADVNGGLNRAAPLVGFPVVIPAELPAGWNPNSFSFVDKSAASATQPAVVRAGWLTDEGRFISLAQSDGAVADVLVAELGAAAAPTGTEQVGDAEWTTTTGRRGESAWVRTVGDVTLLITGSASPAAFQALATATTAGAVVAG